MSKLSVEEKSKKMMEIFYDGREFYQIKELEKLSKSKGIGQNEMKEILQSLIADERIECDKIGSTLFYWSFPEKKIEEDKKKSDGFKMKNKELNDKIMDLEETLKQIEDSKKEATYDEKFKREHLTNEIDELKAKENDLMEYINSSDNTSIDDVNNLRTGIKELTIAVNRWTDNIFNMMSWFRKKFPSIDQTSLEKEFRIPTDLDYFSVD